MSDHMYQTHLTDAASSGPQLEIQLEPLLAFALEATRRGLQLLLTEPLSTEQIQAVLAYIDALSDDPSLDAAVHAAWMQIRRQVAARRPLAGRREQRRRRGPPRVA